MRGFVLSIQLVSFYLFCHYVYFHTKDHMNKNVLLFLLTIVSLHIKTSVQQYRNTIRMMSAFRSGSLHRDRAPRGTTLSPKAKKTF